MLRKNYATSILMRAYLIEYVQKILTNAKQIKRNNILQWKSRTTFVKKT